MAVTPANPSLQTMIQEFGAVMLQVAVSPHSNVPPPAVLAAPRVTVLAQTQDSKLWKSCFFKDYFPSGWVRWARSQHRTQAIALVQLWGQETRHYRTQPLAPQNGSSLLSISPCLLPPLTAESLSCTGACSRALEGEIPGQVSSILSGHPGAQFSLYTCNTH